MIEIRGTGIVEDDRVNIRTWAPLDRRSFPLKWVPDVIVFHYRINGTVYTTKSPEFIEAWEKEAMWVSLERL